MSFEVTKGKRTPVNGFERFDSSHIPINVSLCAYYVRISCLFSQIQFEICHAPPALNPQIKALGNSLENFSTFLCEN